MLCVVMFPIIYVHMCNVCVCGGSEEILFFNADAYVEVGIYVPKMRTHTFRYMCVVDEQL